ncbi:ESPR domain-containing protein, partial [Megamonas hypermegale]|uniref:ESPR domain-containing protein n=1 Tax=Megamonas hypermegale TaxID=158847 RepID=UPI0026F33D80
MNKIYKVIWSKVKNQYVVVSELAHSCTKSASRKTVGKTAAAVLAALVITSGAVAPVEAGSLSIEGEVNLTDDYVVGENVTDVEGKDIANALKGETLDVAGLTVGSEEVLTEADVSDIKDTANEAWNKANNAQGTANE